MRGCAHALADLPAVPVPGLCPVQREGCSGALLGSPWEDASPSPSQVTTVPAPRWQGCRSSAAPQALLGNVNSLLLRGGLLPANPPNSCALAAARSPVGLWGCAGRAGGGSAVGECRARAQPGATMDAEVRPEAAGTFPSQSDLPALSAAVLIASWFLAAL